MVKLIPMAGAGKRFSEQGYTVPKPLLPINGRYMVLSAADALPKSDQTIFICQKDHINQFGLNKALDSYGKIVSIEGVTEGQASTCLEGCINIVPEEELLIGASDNGMIYDADLFEKLKKEADILVFGFKDNPTVLKNPEAYGWIICDENGIISQISVKKPISKTPLNDWAITGAFYFKKSKYFTAAAKEMIYQNRRINNEFYIDECINDAINMGLKVLLMPVKFYICWGTPDDYETYLYWQRFFTKEQPNFLEV
ncbi:Nucleotidyl transferase [Brevinema andersonii]|uniref:Nucleotidyl transferase n=1 Tax=Brevinema andersonii TaxID=34097 RepID=A0A1I1D7Z7_BREAD|nr:sugar phosphate nucleotidyltransferase [Brevinema andersonii]SFB68940.1 Nucleotidyl transferase [Brevinema andersonii]